MSAREIPWTADAPYFLIFHDRDLAMDVGSVARLLAGLGAAIQYMTANEYCAYLHAAVTGDSRALTLEYDDHYCRYFAAHASSWTLHRSGAAPETQTVEIPKGLGRHVVRVGNPALPARSSAGSLRNARGIM